MPMKHNQISNTIILKYKNSNGQYCCNYFMYDDMDGGRVPEDWKEMTNVIQGRGRSLV